jgi:hypothetical protein
MIPLGYAFLRFLSTLFAVAHKETRHFFISSIIEFEVPSCSYFLKALT